MNFNDYQEAAAKTAKYPGAGTGEYIYPTLGLANEAGEVAGKVKKILRDGGGVLTDERRADIKGELGDVLWYVARVASELNLTLEDVAQGNIEKLASRATRGVINGNGDNR